MKQKLLLTRKVFTVITNTPIKKSALNLSVYLIFILLIGLQLNLSYGQSQVWTQPPNQITGFANTVTVSAMPGGMVGSLPSGATNYAHNAYEDVNGNPLFYILEGYVYGINASFGQPIYEPTSGTVLLGVTEYLIVPVPGNCHQYYLIAGNFTNNSTVGRNPMPFFIRLNIDVNGVFHFIDNAGQIMSVGNATPLGSPTTFQNYDMHTEAIHFAVTPLRASTNDRFLYISNADHIFRYRITSSDIIYDNYNYFITTNEGSSHLKSEMEIVKLANGNYKLAVPFEYNSSSSPPNSQYFIGIYDVNTNGDISNNINYNVTPNTNIPVGLEFSPNGDFLFMTTTQSPYFGFINTSTNSFTALNVANAADFKNSQIEVNYYSTVPVLYLVAADRYAMLTDLINPSSAVFTDPVPGTANLNPNVPLSNFGINGSTYSMRLMNDQIDGENYNSNFLLNEPTCCDDFSIFDAEEFKAPIGTQTWTASNNPFTNINPVRMRGTLTIPTGSNLAINNMTFEFGYNGKVIVEPGATLTLNGTKFTNNQTCGVMWQGVEVWGKTASPQDLTQQGKIILQTFGGQNSEISYACNAVRLWNPLDYGQAGGYIKAHDARFFNNWRSLEFIMNNVDPITSSYTSNIDNCTFEATTGSLLYPYNTSQYNFETRPNVFITMWAVRNVVFNRENFFNNSHRGIFSIDANYNLSNANFLDCDYGIYSKKVDAAFESNHIFDNISFRNYSTAMRIDGGLNDHITNNNFNYLNNPSTLGSQMSNYEGIRLESCGGFDITDNRFYFCKAGLTVVNSGDLGGVIESNGNPYGNYFYFCWRGIQTFKDNHRLSIKCNTFTNQQSSLFYSAAWAIFGELANQGVYNLSDPYSPVHNEFNKPANRIDIYSVPKPNVGGVNFIYYHYFPDPLGIPTAGNTVLKFNTSLGVPPDACDGWHIDINDPQEAIDFINAEQNEAVREMMISELIVWYINHNQLNDAISYLEQRGDASAKERLLALYVQYGALTEALALVNELANNTDQESIDFVTLNTMIINWNQNNISPFSMSQQEHDVIQQIAERETRVAVQAKAVLSLVYDQEFVAAVMDTAIERLANSEIGQGDDKDWIKSIQPNPASNQIKIEFAHILGQDASLNIIDVTGRIILKVEVLRGIESKMIDLTQIAPGIYNLTIVFKGQPVQVVKFIKL